MCDVLCTHVCDKLHKKTPKNGNWCCKSSEKWGHFLGFDLNHEEFFEDLPFLQNASNQNYVPDAVLPPGEPWLHGGPSRAALSLPSCLCLCGDIESRMSGPGSSGKEQMGDMKVYARCHLQQGVLFGPFVGEICRGQMPSNLKYTWAVSTRVVIKMQFKIKSLQIVVLFCASVRSEIHTKLQFVSINQQNFHAELVINEVDIRMAPTPR